MEPALISSFWSVRRMRVWLLLDGTLMHRWLAPSRRWYSFTYPGRMESWVSLGGKEGRINIRISARPGLNWGACGRKAEILYQLRQPCPPNHPRQQHLNFPYFACNLMYYSFYFLRHMFYECKTAFQNLVLTKLRDKTADRVKNITFLKRTRTLL